MKRYIFFTISMFFTCLVLSGCDFFFPQNNNSLPASPVILVSDVSTNFIEDGLNCIGVLGFILGSISLYFTIITFIAQKKTEIHTSNAPKSAQIGKLKDLPRHFYRNLVCVFAIIIKYNDDSNNSLNGKKSYPSESNVLKLKTLPDEIIYDIDIDEKTYTNMHEFKLLLRNYNTEVEVASNHFSRKIVIDQDIDNIIFKQLYLLYRSYDILMLLEKNLYPRIIANSIHIMIIEHFKKLKENNEFKENNEYWNYVNNVLETKDVNKEFKRIIDPKESLKRSIKNIYKSVETYYNNRYSELTKLKKEYNGIIFEFNDKKELKVQVNKKKFIDSIIKNGENKYRDLHVFIVNLCDPTSDIDKCIKYEKEFIKKNTIAYFNFIRDKDYWDFNELLIHMLVMDSIIETSKIGMVNFSQTEI